MLKTGDIIERQEDESLIIDVSGSGYGTYIVTEFIDGTIMIKPKKENSETGSIR